MPRRRRHGKHSAVTIAAFAAAAPVAAASIVAAVGVASDAAVAISSSTPRDVFGGWAMSRIEELSFSELVHELCHYEHDPQPPDPARTIRRRHLDARLMRLLTLDRPVEERRATMRVRGDIAVRLFVDDRVLDGMLVDIGEGGARVRIDEHTLERDALELGLGMTPSPPRASVRVRWRRPRVYGLELGLSFEAQSDAHRRRVRALILELLRRMPEPLH
jgi:hypothetical protein